MSLQPDSDFGVRHSTRKCSECGTTGRVTDEGDHEVCQSCGTDHNDRRSVSFMDRVYAELAGEDNRGGRRRTS